MGVVGQISFMVRSKEQILPSNIQILEAFLSTASAVMEVNVVINLDGPDLLQSAPNCFHANLLFVALWFMLFKSF